MISPANFSIRALVRALLILTASAATALAAPVKFDIAAQPAPAALDVFIKQSGAQVVYLLEDVKDAKTNAVSGSYEVSAALALLLKDTGLSFSEKKPGQFSVGRTVVRTGSVKGVLLGETGKTFPEVFVTIRETGQSATTNRVGEYFFPEVVAGTYMFVATAPGYQPLHITEVVVRAGRDLTLSKQQMQKPLGETMALEPFIVRADSVTELDKFQITGTKAQPFSASNVDISRTENDARPYYIFDAEMIEQSGSVSVEDFLKQRLTMNAAALSNNQVALAGTAGNTSSFNLRGVGAGSTLVLVNGRRLAGVTISTGGAAQATPGQPDVNGVPLSAIERIEVLPSSASGIYGGSALGGVINIILKSNYRGGELRVTYDNTFDTDAPRRTASVNFGTTFEGGKSSITLNAQVSDSQPLLLRDRLDLYQRGFNLLRANDPTAISGTTSNPFLGATPNIMNLGGTAALVLKPSFGGTSLGSPITFIPVGTAPSTTGTALGSALTANAGQLNFNLPDTTQTPTGLRRQFGVSVETKAFRAGFRRQMLPSLDFYADFSVNENHSEGIYNAFNNAALVPTTAPTNPFTTSVFVRYLSSADNPMLTASDSRSFSTGFVAKLPAMWTLLADFTWSDNRYSFDYSSFDVTGFGNAINTGVLNPFADLAAYPLDLTPYHQPIQYGGASTQEEFSLRASGPLPSLPWGQMTLTPGLSHRKSGNPERTYTTEYPITTASNNTVTYYSLYQWVDSAYAELLVPLVKRDRFAFLYDLELQVSGRQEWYRADTGTTGYSLFPNRPASSGYLGTTVGGAPYRAKQEFTADGYSVGLKYQPIPEVTARASYATAFIPVTPAQLFVNPNAPITAGTLYSTWSPGNADLKPQNSESTNIGLIWEPRWAPLEGLRLNVEYYEIVQHDVISSVPAATIVAFESLFPGRVTRDASGNITLVDTSAANVFKRETAGWDLTLEYRRKTSIGTFSFSAVESIIDRLKTQYSLTAPDYDAVNFPAEAGAVKYKSNARLTWNFHNWTLGWTTVYYSSYKQQGAAGGPIASERLASGRAPFTTYITRQGGDTIPSQTYHDAFVSYAFGRGHTEGKSLSQRITGKILDDVVVQFGVRNVFDTLPPYDATYDTNYYISPFGDSRLRSYWLSVSKRF